MAADIHGFLHVAKMNNWRDVLTSHLDLIYASGLYDAATEIHVGVVGPECLEFCDLKLTLLYHEPNLRRFELKTIHELQQFCQRHPDVKVWYTHTKGVSKPRSPQAKCWREYMEYFVVERHADCIGALDECDVCGADWRTCPFPHFSGNFWWARADYVNRLAPVNCSSQNRMLAEKFIGTGSPRVACFHQSHVRLYQECYSRDRYCAVSRPDTGHRRQFFR
jgi:hypothetical protein